MIMNTRSPIPFDPAQSQTVKRDAFGEIFHLLKLTGTFYCQSRLTAPWGIAVPAMPDVMTFLVVTRGRCYLRQGGAPNMALAQGDFLLLTAGKAHEVLSDPNCTATPLDQLPVEPVSEVYETLSFGGGGETTQLMYGVMRPDHAASSILMALLPDQLHISRWSQSSTAWLQGTMQFIADEAQEQRPGGEMVITRLADVLVIEAIRTWLNTRGGAESGWVRAVRDPQIGRALVQIHQCPDKDWSVHSLAQVAGMSRSAFSAKFTNLIDMSVKRYLTMWRMHLARDHLLRTTQPISAIAAELGYSSEPTFHRAFKRVFGIPPGAVRRHADRQEMDAN